MAEIPHSVVPRTQPSRQGLDYLRADGASPEAFGAGIGRGLQQLARGVEGFGQAYQERKDRADRFQMMEAQSVFGTDLTRLSLEMQQGVEGPGAGFAENYSEAAAALTDQYVGKVAPNLQGEARARFQQMLQGEVRQNLLFEFQYQDQYYKQQIDAFQTRAINDIYSNPNSTETWARGLEELLTTSTLNDIEKQEIREKIGANLLLTEFKSKVRAGVISPEAIGIGARTPADVGILKSRTTGSHVDVEKLPPGVQSELTQYVKLAPPNVKISSGHRGADHPVEAKKPGGPGEHSRGAFDLSGFTNEQQKQEAIDYWLSRGAKGIGWYSWGVHVDFREQPGGWGPNTNDLSGAPEWFKLRVAQLKRGDFNANIPNLTVSSLEDRIIQAESGGNPNARAGTSSAAGLGQFTAGTWDAVLAKHRPELFNSLTPAERANARLNPELAREMVGAHLGDLRTELTSRGLPADDGSLYLAWFLGAGGASRVLSAPPGTSLEEAVGAEQIAANPGVFRGLETVEDIRAWAQNKMGSAEPIAIADPRYASIPLQYREAAYADAVREREGIIREQQARLQKQRDAQVNALNVGLSDGTLGRSAIVAAREAGWLTDYNDIDRAERIYADKNKKDIAYADVVTQLQDTTYTWDSTKADDKDALDLFLSRNGGRAGIQSGDEATLATLSALVSRTGMIPPSAITALEQLSYSGDPSKLNYAYTTLAALDAAAPQSFRNLADEDVQKRLNRWQVLSDYLPGDKLAETMRDMADPAKAGLRKTLTEQANEIIEENYSDPLAVRDLVAGGFLGFGAAELPITNLQAGALQRDFSEAFTEAFAQTGDENLAREEALKWIGNKWGPTDTGASSRIMPYPPEKVYGPINGSTDWIGDQFAGEMAETFGEAYNDNDFAIGFDTRSEGLKKAGQPVEYPVFVTGDDGIPRQAIIPPEFDDEGIMIRPPRLRYWRPDRTLAQQTELNRLEAIPPTPEPADVLSGQDPVMDELQSMREGMEPPPLPPEPPRGPAPGAATLRRRSRNP